MGGGLGGHGGSAGDGGMGGGTFCGTSWMPVRASDMGKQASGLGGSGFVLTHALNCTMTSFGAV